MEVVGAAGAKAWRWHCPQYLLGDPGLSTLKEMAGNFS